MHFEKAKDSGHGCSGRWVAKDGSFTVSISKYLTLADHDEFIITAYAQGFPGGTMFRDCHSWEEAFNAAPEVLKHCKENTLKNLIEEIEKNQRLLEQLKKEM